MRFGADGKPHDETKIRKQSCAELDALAEGRRAKELACTGRDGDRRAGDTAARR